MNFRNFIHSERGRSLLTDAAVVLCFSALMFYIIPKAVFLMPTPAKAFCDFAVEFVISDSAIEENADEKDISASDYSDTAD